MLDEGLYLFWVRVSWELSSAKATTSSTSTTSNISALFSRLMGPTRRRCALAESRCGELRHVFGSGAIPLKLKLKIYQTAVASLLTYGSEAWSLTERTMAMINGCNARCLSHVTGLSAHAEASPHTRTFDMVGAIRQRRYRWLGHILRMPDERLVKEAIRV